MTPELVQMLKNVNIELLEKKELVDVSRFQLDYSLANNKRMAYILEHTKNPYCFRYKNLGVKIEFSPSSKTLHQVIEDFLINKKMGHRV